ncbi:hypothetical protein GYH30_017593 [Glycine max]|nr:hypothetical protein GYH30_017593 [Glycine max]
MCLPTSLFTSPSNSNHSFNLHSISCQGPHDHNEQHQDHKAPTGQHHHGVLVGEARGPPGRAKARRTLRMNVTIDVITDRVVSWAGEDLELDISTQAIKEQSCKRKVKL